MIGVLSLMALRLLLTPEEARSAKSSSQPQHYSILTPRTSDGHTSDELKLPRDQILGRGSNGEISKELAIWKVVSIRSAIQHHRWYKDAASVYVSFLSSSPTLTSSNSYSINSHLIPYFLNTFFSHLHFHQLQYEIHNRLQHWALERSPSSCCTNQQSVSLNIIHFHMSL